MQTETILPYVPGSNADLEAWIEKVGRDNVVKRIQEDEMGSLEVLPDFVIYGVIAELAAEQGMKCDPEHEGSDNYDEYQ